MSAYVLPPINLPAIKAGTSRFGITDAMLVSSTVPEVPPAAYNAGTTYAELDEVATGTTGGVISVWASKQNGNLGQTVEEGVWWRFLGNTYAVYSGAATYAEGDVVIYPATHTVWESLVAGNTGNALTDTTKWLARGATNRWAMFDMFASAGTVDAVAPLTVVLAPGRVGELGMTGIDGDTAQVTMLDGATEVYPTATHVIDGSIVNNWEDYFFAPFRLQDLLFIRGLPTYTDGQITVTVTGFSATSLVTLTKLLVGNAVDMGKTRVAPEIRRGNFSELDRAVTSELLGITNRRFVRLVSTLLAVPKASVRNVNATLDDVLYAPCLWIGIDNLEDDYAYLVALLGLALDSRLSPKAKLFSDLSLEIEEV